MAEAGNPNYEMRQQARGVPQPPPVRPWRKRLTRAGTILLVVVLIGGSIAIWWHHTRVRTVSARVQAAVVELAPVIDARLLELHVTEGQHVTKGQVLARLDESELQASLEASESNLLIKQSALTEAQANVLLAKSEVETNIERAKAQAQVRTSLVTRAQAAIVSRKANLADEILVADARRNESRVRLEELKRGPRKEDVESSEAKHEATEALLALYRLELEQSRKLATEGIDSQHLLEVRRTQVITQEKAVKSASLDLARLRSGATKEEIEAAEHALSRQVAELALAKSGSNDLVTLQAELAVCEAELREAETLVRRAEGQRAAVAVAEARAQAATGELTRAAAEVKGLRAALDSRDFVSPVNGTVTRTYVRVGEVCRKGVACILVADDSKPRWVECFVREADAMLVDVGQRAWVRVPANNGRYVKAVVDQVGLHTDSQDGGTTAAGRSTRQMQERVWVRIRPLKPLAGNPVTGTSARGIIRVR